MGAKLSMSLTFIDTYQFECVVKLFKGILKELNKKGYENFSKDDRYIYEFCSNFISGVSVDD